MDYFIEPETQQVDSKTYIDFTRNKLSKAAIFPGLSLKFDGKAIVREGTVIRGDQGKCNIGLHTTLEKDVVIKPPLYIQPNGRPCFNLFRIGKYSYVGDNSLIEAKYIGDCVYIGKNCSIGPRVIIRDCVYIEDNTVIPADSSIAPFSHIAGTPATFIGEVPETFAITQRLFAEEQYNRLQSSSE
ncbi:hypothetical protein WA158_002037 [Blastocystis sp. Blastoise]